VQTYTVHEPTPAAEDLDDRATRLVFVKEGFAWLAFVAPELWLLFKWMWRELIAYIVLVFAIAFAVRYSVGSPSAIAWSIMALRLVFGFEARNLYRNALARKGYEVVGIVTERDLEASERRFLSEWLPSAKEDIDATKPPARPRGVVGAPLAAG
jgi:hypothetical protein